MAKVILTNRLWRCLRYASEDVVAFLCFPPSFLTIKRQDYSCHLQAAMGDLLGLSVASCYTLQGGPLMHPHPTILLVEDNAIIQRLTAQTLRQLSCQVVIAPTAKEAYHLANTQIFDLILMDVGLPDGDGFAISQYLRSHEESPNQTTPIVIVTAHFTDEAAQKRCEAIGINALYPKPFTRKQMQSVLMTLPPAAPSQVFNSIIKFFGEFGLFLHQHRVSH